MTTNQDKRPLGRQLECFDVNRYEDNLSECFNKPWLDTGGGAGSLIILSSAGFVNVRRELYLQDWSSERSPRSSHTDPNQCGLKPDARQPDTNLQRHEPPRPVPATEPSVTKEARRPGGRFVKAYRSWGPKLLFLALCCFCAVDSRPIFKHDAEPPPETGHFTRRAPAAAAEANEPSKCGDEYDQPDHVICSIKINNITYSYPNVSIKECNINNQTCYDLPQFKTAEKIACYDPRESEPPSEDRYAPTCIHNNAAEPSDASYKLQFSKIVYLCLLTALVFCVLFGFIFKYLC